MEIQPYLDRISISTIPAATTENLRTLQLAHLYHIPFENLDVARQTPINLAPDALFDKLITRQRGGFCYELNGLFARLLTALGFQVTLLAAQDAGEDGEFGPEYDHMALMVSCPDDPKEPETEWLVDVGWGDTFRWPLRLNLLNLEQPDSLAIYKIQPIESSLLLMKKHADETWEWQYRFSLQPRTFEAYESTCLYHQTSPDSHFTQGRIVTLATETGRITLSDNQFIQTTHDQRQSRTVDDDEYATILANQFNIHH